MLGLSLRVPTLPLREHTDEQGLVLIPDAARIQGNVWGEDRS